MVDGGKSALDLAALESVTCGQFLRNSVMRRLCRTLVRKAAPQAASRPNHSRANGQTSTALLIAIARRISKHRTELSFDRRLRQPLSFLQGLRRVTGGLHSHLHNPELIAVEADEIVALGSQIVEPYFQSRNAQVGDR
jgi:hypothetical protein